MEGTGEIISDLEDGTVEIILSEQLRENRMEKKKERREGESEGVDKSTC